MSGNGEIWCQKEKTLYPPKYLLGRFAVKRRGFLVISGKTASQNCFVLSSRASLVVIMTGSGVPAQPKTTKKI